MRAQMLEYFPTLERAFDYKTSKASLVLLTGYQTPATLRRIGGNRLATWPKNRKVCNSQLVAATAVQAAEAQHTAVAGEKLAATVVAKLAREVMTLDEEIADTDALIEGRFSATTRMPRSSRACQASAPSWAPSSSPTPAAT